MLYFHLMNPLRLLLVKHHCNNHHHHHCCLLHHQGWGSKFCRCRLLHILFLIPTIHYLFVYQSNDCLQMLMFICGNSWWFCNCCCCASIRAWVWANTCVCLWIWFCIYAINWACGCACDCPCFLASSKVLFNRSSLTHQTVLDLFFEN